MNNARILGYSIEAVPEPVNGMVAMANTESQCLNERGRSRAGARNGSRWNGIYLCAPSREPFCNRCMERQDGVAGLERCEGQMDVERRLSKIQIRRRQSDQKTAPTLEIPWKTGSFDDGYETKIQTRQGNLGTDLPTLLDLLGKDQF